MKKFGFATIIASGLVAGALGFAAPAIQAVASPARHHHLGGQRASRLARPAPPERQRAPG